MQLQVSVESEDGEFVTGLQPQDFLLEIDGEPRQRWACTVCDHILYDHPTIMLTCFVSCGAKHSIFNAFEALLSPGDEALVSFAIWNGAGRDLRGQKSVTLWHVLELGE